MTDQAFDFNICYTTNIKFIKNTQSLTQNKIYSSVIEKYVNSDENIKSFYVIDDYFKDFAEGTNVFHLQAKESNKNLETVNRILEQIFKSNLRRKDKIIGIGGGITLDIASFCASIYNRGCHLTLIPTTIIGMLDASIGGKTGVNYNNIKNQIGSFYPANEIIIDFDFINTLPNKEIENGFAELIKMMIIFERDFFFKDFDFIRENLNDYICKSINYKSIICQEDILDKGKRHVLNLGHTYGHMYESVTDFNISHGEAVAKGLKKELNYSREQGLLSNEWYERITKYVNHFCSEYIFSSVELQKIDLFANEILSRDKKCISNNNLILVNNEGVIF